MRQRMLVASLLATSGSVIENPERISPASRGASHCRFCSSLAYWESSSMLPTSGAEQLKTSGAHSTRPMISLIGA
jgi:beta-xylosidase